MKTEQSLFNIFITEVRAAGLSSFKLTTSDFSGPGITTADLKHAGSLRSLRDQCANIWKQRQVGWHSTLKWKQTPVWFCCRSLPCCLQSGVLTSCSLTTKGARELKVVPTDLDHPCVDPAGPHLLSLAHHHMHQQKHSAIATKVRRLPGLGVDHVIAFNCWG